MNNIKSNNPRLAKWLTYSIISLTVAVFLGFIVNRAWMSDDAYITLRTVDNFIHGYGLVWNVGERVQVYTHPLWMFLISLFYAFTHEAYFTTIFLSLSVSLAAAFCLVFLASKNHLTGALGLLMLSLSGAFLDYSTSGLENPLTHLLLVLFAWIYFKRGASPRNLFWLSIIASLAAVNRLDSILLFLPALTYLFLQNRSWRNFGWIILGQMPLIAWEFFSLIYYGFLIPNTAYAKLNATIPELDFINRGLVYFKYTFQHDPWTTGLIILGLISVWLSQNKKQSFFFGAGIILYLVYIIWVGGDFMEGRFFTAPALAALLLLVQFPLTGKRIRVSVPLLSVAVILAGISLVPPWKTYPSKPPPNMKDTLGIGEERLYYYGQTGLMSGIPWALLPDHEWRDAGTYYRDTAQKLVVDENVGLMGYYAGPKVYIVDVFALCDPLLARLPFNPKVNEWWRIGHFIREIPDGYLEEVMGCEGCIINKNIEAFYAILRNVTRENLWEKSRWINIVKMNMGFYNYLLKQ